MKYLKEGESHKSKCGLPTGPRHQLGEVLPCQCDRRNEIVNPFTDCSMQRVSFVLVRLFVSKDSELGFPKLLQMEPVPAT